MIRLSETFRPCKKENACLPVRRMLLVSAVCAQTLRCLHLLLQAVALGMVGTAFPQPVQCAGGAGCVPICCQLVHQLQAAQVWDG